LTSESHDRAFKDAPYTIQPYVMKWSVISGDCILP
jgi:hypothetical protein